MVCFDLPRFLIKHLIKPHGEKRKPEATTPVPEAAAPKVITATPAPTSTIKTYKVTGLSHYEDNILAMRIENEDFQLSRQELIDDDRVDERVWEYEFFPIRAELVPEPDNPHDPKAIKVLVDDQHVGYIKEGSCAHLLKVMAEGRVEKINVEIGGGRYKILHLVDCTEDGKDVYELDRDAVPLYVHLSIVETIA